MDTAQLASVAMLIETFAIDADYRGAIGYAQRYLALDELAENIHRRLIELYGSTAIATRPCANTSAVS